MHWLEFLIVLVFVLAYVWLIYDGWQRFKRNHGLDD